MKFFSIINILISLLFVFEKQTIAADLNFERSFSPTGVQKIDFMNEFELLTQGDDLSLYLSILDKPIEDTILVWINSASQAADDFVEPDYLPVYAKLLNVALKDFSENKIKELERKFQSDSASLNNKKRELIKYTNLLLKTMYLRQKIILRYTKYLAYDAAMYAVRNPSVFLESDLYDFQGFSGLSGIDPIVLEDLRQKEEEIQSVISFLSENTALNHSEKSIGVIKTDSAIMINSHDELNEVFQTYHLKSFEEDNDLGIDLTRLVIRTVKKIIDRKRIQDPSRVAALSYRISEMIVLMKFLKVGIQDVYDEIKKSEQQDFSRFVEADYIYTSRVFEKFKRRYFNQLLSQESKHFILPLFNQIKNIKKFYKKQLLVENIVNEEESFLQYLSRFIPSFGDVVYFGVDLTLRSLIYVLSSAEEAKAK